ncbi:hypothetical protein JCM11491_005231 [Sporobolomyces phaffii]
MSTTRSTVLTLPTELIDEILRSNVLSNQDLARCCLTSRQFLPAARRSLYDSIKIQGENAGVCYTGTSLVNYIGLDRASEKLYETLQASPTLGRHTTSIEFRRLDSVYTDIDMVPFDIRTSQTAFDLVLRLAPNARQIAFNATWLRDMDAGYDLHGVDKVVVHEVSSENAHDLWIPSQVRALKLTIWQDINDLVIEPRGISITALDINVYDDSYTGAVVVSAPNLRVLRCPPRYIINNPTSLSDVTQLLLHIHHERHATYLLDIRHFSPLSKLRNLRFLSFEMFELSHYIENAVKLTLASLRPDQRPIIHFPRLVPFDLLSKMLELGTLPANRIQLPSIVSDTDPSDASQLQQLCAAQGVELEWVPSGPIDIFKIKLEEP